MTISDEELYRLAENVGQHANFSNPMARLEINKLRQAVLQRFKPREPRVIEQRGAMVLGSFITECPSPVDFKSYVKYHDGYLAKAIITEVMDSDPKPTESE